MRKCIFIAPKKEVVFVTFDLVLIRNYLYNDTENSITLEGSLPTPTPPTPAPTTPLPPIFKWTYAEVAHIVHNVCVTFSWPCSIHSYMLYRIQPYEQVFFVLFFFKKKILYTLYTNCNEKGQTHTPVRLFAAPRT